MLSVAAFVLASNPQAELLEPKVRAIFEDACTMCHDASSDDFSLEGAPSGMLGLKSSVNGRPFFVPGDPAASYLYLKMIGAQGIDGDVMPLGDDPLPRAQLDVLRDWILALAADAGAGADPDEPGPDGAAGPQEGADGGGGYVEPPTRAPARRAPFGGTHQIALHTTTTLGRNVIEFRVHHRFGRVGKPGDRAYLGLASGAVMSLGVAYGIVDGLDVLARWSNSRLDWEVGVKYVPVRQEAGLPVSFGGYGSFEALTEPPERAANRITGNGQLFLSRLWFDRWVTQLTVGYSWLTNHAPKLVLDLGDGPREYTDDRGTLYFALASTVLLGKKKRHGIDLEYSLPVPSDAFYYNGGNANPNGAKIGSWSVGWSARAGLHFFQVFVTNTQNIHTNLFAPGGDTANPFDPFGEFFFGFNISRKWNLGRKGGRRGGSARKAAASGPAAPAPARRDGADDAPPAGTPEPEPLHSSPQPTAAQPERPTR